MDYKQNIKNSLKLLTGDGAIGVSGQEQEVISVVLKLLEGYVDEIKVSTTGNITAMKRGKASGPTLAVSAHMDEVGYRVKMIMPNGFLLISASAGIPGSVSFGRKVWVSRDRIPGVIGIKPGHLQTPDEMKCVPDITKAYVDVGCSSEEEARALGIEVGNPVICQNDFMEFKNPDLICTRAIDNRINCAVLIELLRTLKCEDFDGILYGLFSIREEVGLLGAKNTLYDIDNIDYAITLDTIPAADTPDTVAGLPLFLGKGPGLTISEDANFHFYMIHPGVKKHIIAAAEKAGVGLQLISMAGISYLTEASAYAYEKGGLPVAAMTVPRRYSHSPVEVANVNDASDLVKVLLNVVSNNSGINLDFDQR